MSTRADPGPISGDVRLIASTPTIGTVNIGQADVRLIASTPTVGTITVAQGGNTWAVQQAAGFDVRLIASTPTIGLVGGDVRLIASTSTIGFVGGDVRLIASTASIGIVKESEGNVRLLAGTLTAATITTSVQRSTVATAPTVMVCGLFASPTLSANANRKMMWHMNVSSATLAFGLGATPSKTSYHVIQTSPTSPMNTSQGWFDTMWLGNVYVISNKASATCVIGEYT